MKIIPRLERLRKEADEIDRDLGELGAKKAQLEEALSQSREATDKNLIERYRAGQPVRSGDLEAKTKDLGSELAVVEATSEAMQKHRAILEPELAELEQAQKLAAGWHEVGVNFIAAKVLSGQLRGQINRVVASARPEISQNALGEDVVEKSIPASTGGSLAFYIRRLESLVLEVAHRIDPERFPRAETVSLDTTGQPLGWDNRSSRMSDRRILDTIWQEFLRVEGYFLEEHGFDIAPSTEQVSEGISKAIPSPPKPLYH